MTRKEQTYFMMAPLALVLAGLILNSGIFLFMALMVAGIVSLNKLAN